MLRGKAPAQGRQGFSAAPRLRRRRVPSAHGDRAAAPRLVTLRRAAQPPAAAATRRAAAWRGAVAATLATTACSPHAARRWRKRREQGVSHGRAALWSSVCIIDTAPRHCAGKSISSRRADAVDMLLMARDTVTTYGSYGSAPGADQTPAGGGRGSALGVPTASKGSNTRALASPPAAGTPPAAEAAANRRGPPACASAALVLVARRMRCGARDRRGAVVTRRRHPRGAPLIGVARQNRAARAPRGARWRSEVARAAGARCGARRSSSTRRSSCSLSSLTSVSHVPPGVRVVLRVRRSEAVRGLRDAPPCAAAAAAAPAPPASRPPTPTRRQPQQDGAAARPPRARRPPQQERRRLRRAARSS
jgi:hypothetical protein